MHATAPNEPLRVARTAAGLLALALAVRLAFCGGLAVGDDVIYMTQAIAHGLGRAWPPEPGHWNARLGVTLPTAASVAIFGVQRWSLLVLPMAVGSLLIPVAWMFARRMVAERMAMRFALFLCFLPMEVIFSGHLFPDVLEGAGASLAVICLLFALRSGRTVHFVACGALYAAAYLCRETVVLQAPVLAVLLAAHSRALRPRLAWMLAVPLVVLAAEAALYALTTGDPFYRAHSVLGMVRDDGNRELAARIGPSDGFWTAPLVLLVTSHEFGPFFALALPLAVWALLKRDTLWPVALWFLVGYAWTFYGTTDPSDWFPLPRTPRYAMTLCVPAALLCAWGVERLGARWRTAATVTLVGLGLACIALDDSRSMVTPHRSFVAGPHVDSASLDPAEYFAARWVLGLERPPDFACANDLGRSGTVRSLSWLAGTRTAAHAQDRFVVLSIHRDMARVDELRRRGWESVAEYPLEVSPLRRLAGRVLAELPGQRSRAWKILRGPGLVVLENPAQSPAAPPAMR